MGEMTDAYQEPGVSTHESIRLLTLKSTRQPIRYQYDVKIGKQVQHLENAGPSESNFCNSGDYRRCMIVKRAQFSNLNNFNSNLNGNNACRDFCGTCYNCGWKAHSQNFCPLKECTICRKWGHAERVCYHRKGNNSILSNMNGSSTEHINHNPTSNRNQGFCAQQGSKSVAAVGCS